QYVGEARQQPRHLGGVEARAEDGDTAVRPLGPQRGEERVERLAPGNGPQGAVALPRHRRAQPWQLAVTLVRRAAVVAHPIVVDVDVEARLEAADLSSAVLERDVAADVAAGADRRLLVE